MSDEQPRKRRRKGERADGRFQVSCSDGRNPDGSLHRIYFYGSTKTEAERKLSEYKAKKLSGLVEDKKITVNQWIDRWIEIYGIDAAQYAPYIKRLRADVGLRPIADVTEADLVLSMRAYQGRSSSGATKYKSVVQRCFLKAKKNRLITFDPAEDLELPSTARSLGHRALDRWEIDLIITHWRSHRAGLWILLMLFAGLRRGELMALNWDAVDLTARVLRVSQVAVVHGNQTVIEQRAKTIAGLREIPLCQVLYDALCGVPESLREGYVCRPVKGERLTEAGFSRGFEGFCSAMSRLIAHEDLNQRGRRSDLMGAPSVGFHMRPHDLRHTFATMLYTAGVDVKSASYYMGHSDSRVTMEIYTHLSAEQRTKADSVVISAMQALLKR